MTGVFLGSPCTCGFSLVFLQPSSRVPEAVIGSGGSG